MTIIQDIQERWNRLNPFVADLLMAIGLTLVVWLQIWLFTAFRPDFIRFPHPEPQPQDTSFVPYLIAAAAYLPLMLRRKVPWLAVLLTATRGAPLLDKPHAHRTHHPRPDDRALLARVVHEGAAHHAHHASGGELGDRDPGVRLQQHRAGR